MRDKANCQSICESRARCCQSALKINGRLQNRGKNKVKFVVPGRRTFCVTKLCKRMSADGSEEGGEEGKQYDSPLRARIMSVN